MNYNMSAVSQFEEPIVLAQLVTHPNHHRQHREDYNSWGPDMGVIVELDPVTFLPIVPPPSVSILEYVMTIPQPQQQEVIPQTRIHRSLSMPLSSLECNDS